MRFLKIFHQKTQRYGFFWLSLQLKCIFFCFFIACLAIFDEFFNFLGCSYPVGARKKHCKRQISRWRASAKNTVSRWRTPALERAHALAYANDRCCAPTTYRAPTQFLHKKYSFLARFCGILHFGLFIDFCTKSDIFLTRIQHFPACQRFLSRSNAIFAQTKTQFSCKKNRWHTRKCR